MGRLKELARTVLSSMPRPVRERLRPDGFRYALHDAWVQLAMQDLVTPGVVAFDVGANVGLLTGHMSTLVGSRGHVHAFEAHPGCADALRRALGVLPLANTTAVFGCVVDRGGGTIPLYLDARPGGGYASTVVQEAVTPERCGAGAVQAVQVAAVALDDYCEQRAAWPDFVKLDIEGAELFALRGFERGLARRPHLVLEFGNEPALTASETALSYLEARGYALFDTHTYDRITAGDYGARRLLRNIAAIHEARLSATPYARLTRRPLGPVELRVRRSARALLHGASGLEATSAGLTLEPGRYQATFDVTGLEHSDPLGCSVEVDGRSVYRVNGSSQQVVLGYHLAVFDLSRPGRVRFILESDALDARRARTATLTRVTLGPA